MAVKTVAFQDLLMAPASVHPRLGEAEVILAFLTPGLFPIGEGGVVSGYKPGFLEILPFTGRGRFTSLRAHLASRRIYRKPQLLLGLLLGLCFVCLLLIDLLYLGNCGDLFASTSPGCPATILEEPIFLRALEAAAIASVLFLALWIAMAFDPRVQSEGWVIIPEDLLTLLKAARETLAAVNKAKTVDGQAPGFAESVGKTFLSSNAGTLGRALAGPFGEMLATLAAEGALEKDSEKKLLEWKDRARAEIRAHATRAILDSHRLLTGRPPAAVTAEAFANAATLSAEQAGVAGALGSRPPKAPPA